MIVDSKLNGLLISNSYKIGKKLGSGAFGDIYLATHIMTNEEYAAKLEKADTQSP